VKPSNPYANYSTAASLGYADPDAERARAEADIRQTMGVAGEWQFVPSTSASSAPIRSEVPSTAGSATEETAGSSESDRKHEAPVDDVEDERAFKLRKKTVDIGLGEIYDFGLIPIKLKVKKEEPVEPQAASSSSKAVVQDAKADMPDTPPTNAPKMKIQWKRAAFQPAVQEPAPNGVKADFGAETAPEMKVEEHVAVKEEVVTAKAEPEPPIPLEPAKKEEEIPPSLDAPAPTGLFRKRKLPTKR
jgi:WW domain-binding protein 4